LSQPSTVRNGDLLRWWARTVAIFYQTFDPTQSYTGLARAVDPTGLIQPLCGVDIQVVLARTNACGESNSHEET
jgi:hypothetical protein